MALQIFDFVSDRGVRLDLSNGKVLESYSDEVKSGLIEHQVLGRQGAIHQQPAVPPRRTTVQLALIGAATTARWQQICDMVAADSFGRVTHPRWGAYAAVLESATGSAMPGDEGDAINVTLVVVQTGLRDAAKPSPTAVAAAGTAQATQLAQRAPFEPSPVQLGSAALVSSYSAFAAQISSSTLDPGKIRSHLVAIRSAAETIRLGGASFGFRLQSISVVAAALAAYNRALAGRPPIVSHTVPATVSLSTLCVQLYGGARASAMRAEIRRLNRVADTLNVPAGAVLLLSDPVSIKRLSVAALPV